MEFEIVTMKCVFKKKKKRAIVNGSRRENGNQQENGNQRENGILRENRAGTSFLKQDGTGRESLLGGRDGTGNGKHILR